MVRSEKGKNTNEFYALNSNVLSTGQKICYGVNGLLVSLLPAYLFHFVQRFEATEHYFVFAFAVILGTVALFSSYVNVATSLKTRIFVARKDAVEKSFTEGKSKKVDVPEVEKKTNEVAKYESVALSIFYNNALFLFLSVLLAFFLFKSWTPQSNYIATAIVSSGLVALFSTSSSK